MLLQNNCVLRSVYKEALFKHYLNKLEVNLCGKHDPNGSTGEGTDRLSDKLLQHVKMQRCLSIY